MLKWIRWLYEHRMQSRLDTMTAVDVDKALGSGSVMTVTHHQNEASLSGCTTISLDKTRCTFQKSNLLYQRDVFQSSLISSGSAALTVTVSNGLCILC